MIGIGNIILINSNGIKLFLRSSKIIMLYYLINFLKKLFIIKLVDIVLYYFKIVYKIFIIALKDF
jgi:hypothetical protein